MAKPHPNLNPKVVNKLAQTLTKKDQKEVVPDVAVKQNANKKNFRHIRSNMILPEDLRKPAAEETAAKVEFLPDDDLNKTNEKSGPVAEAEIEKVGKAPPSDDFVEIPNEMKGEEKKKQVAQPTVVNPRQYFSNVVKDYDP